MSNYVGFGQNMQYPLPFQTEAVPSSFKSNQAPRPINSVISTVYVPSTSGNASAGGLSTIQVPLGNAAYMANPYLRFKLVANRVAAGNSARFFKGAARAASACISSYQTSINSTLVDNILNYGVGVADTLLAHACSSNYLTKDGSVLFDALTTKADAAVQTDVYVLPLLGLLACCPLFWIPCPTTIYSMHRRRHLDCQSQYHLRLETQCCLLPPLDQKTCCRNLNHEHRHRK
jgi:hypothetical protein